MEDSTTVKETTTISGGLPPTGLLDLSPAAVASTQNAADRSLDVADSEAAASSLLFSIPMKSFRWHQIWKDIRHLRYG